MLKGGTEDQRRRGESTSDVREQIMTMGYKPSRRRRIWKREWQG